MKTDRSLRQTGFDIQFSDGGAKGFLDEIGGRGDPREERERRQGTIQAIAAALRKKDSRYLAKSFENLAALEEMKTFGLDMVGVRYRDVKMGANLLWLANEWYKGRKVIVWAASTHVSYDIDKIPFDFYKGYATMGHIAHEVLGQEMYTMAFTACQGRAGNAWTAPRDLVPAAAGSLEALFHFAGKPYAFVDFRGLPAGHWLRGTLSARPYGYLPMETDWTSHFDAMIFTDTMYPNTSEGTVPDGVKTKRTGR